MTKAVERKAATEFGEVAGRDVAEVAARSMGRTLMSQAQKRIAEHAVPVIGAAFSIPDMLTGLEDIRHGHVGLGAATIGIATVDALSNFLHLTDEFTAGGGTYLALTIQGWGAAMQFAFATERVGRRSQELMDYIRKHNGGLPSKDELDGVLRPQRRGDPDSPERHL